MQKKIEFIVKAFLLSSPFLDMCLARGARALNQNGMIYTPDNIDALLNSRYETKKIRMAGGRIKGPQKRRPEQNEEFERAIEKMIG